MDLYELYLVLRKRRLLLAAWIGGFLLAGVVACLILPPVYRTKAVIMPLKSEGIVIPQLLADFLSLSGSRSQAAVAAVLESRHLKERLIRHLDLLPKLFPKKWDEKEKRWHLKEGEEPPSLEDGIRALKRIITIRENKRLRTLEIIVEFKEDPEMARRIAEGVLEEAREILKEKSFSLAAHSRLSLEKRLEEMRKKIRMLEEIYREFSAGRLKEVPLLIEEKDIRELSVPPELTSAKEKALKRLSRLPGHVSAPDYQLNLLKLQSQLEMAFALYELLLKQYELFRAREMQETVAFQVIDPPYLPPQKHPYRPKKALLLALSLIFGAATGIFLVFFLEWLAENRQKVATHESSSPDEALFS